MSDALCNFHPNDGRWPPSMASMTSPMAQHMPPAMNTGAAPPTFTLPPTLPRQGFGQSFHQDSGMPSVTSGSALGGQLSGNMPMQAMYQTTFGGVSTAGMTGASSPGLSAQDGVDIPCSVPGGVGSPVDCQDMWRGTSIASLRRKALEHAATLNGIFRWIQFWLF